MKNPIYFIALVSILFLGSASYATSQTASEEVEFPKHIDRKFRRDAARLALRMEGQKEDYRYLGVEIPPENIEMIYGALKSIYLNDETARSLTDCNIHTFPDPAIERVVVIFEENETWAKTISQKTGSGSNQAFHGILQKFNLRIEKQYQWNESQEAITIRSRKPVNIAAIGNEIYNIDGISEIDFGIPAVKGNDIKMTRVSEGWEFQFELLFGNYLTGDGESHRWKYLVTDNKEVKFLVEEGDPVPDWMRCMIKPSPIMAIF